MVKISEEEYRCAYKEVIVILNVIDKNLKRLIPKSKIEFYEKNMDLNHEFEYDLSKTINEQKILYPTRCILANLFKNYIATEEDREIIIRNENEELRVLEENKSKKYNPSSIFENADNNSEVKSKVKYNDKDINESISSEMMIEIKNKISIFEIIKNRIKIFFESLRK